MYRQKIVDVDAVNLMSAACLICAAVLSHQRRRKYIDTMREFNTLGPINPQYHYHVNRVAVKAALREKVEKGRYMTLNAARQTGKTTLFRELIEELEAMGDYFGILLDFEQLADFSGERFMNA